MTINTIKELRNTKYLRTVYKQSKKYRDKLSINSSLIQKVFLEENRPPELGRFRHGTRFCNYDLLIEEIQAKWLKEETHGLCQEIIHAVSNKCNDEIFSSIVSIKNKQINELQNEVSFYKRKSSVLEILLSKERNQHS